MNRAAWERVLVIIAAMAPIVVAVVLIQLSEPFPDDLLTWGNPHFWANLLRTATFFLGGVVIGLIAYTMVRSFRAEATVTGGHPRRMLYRHVSFIAGGHGLLMMSTLFYIRERVNYALSPATPCVIIGLAMTLYALRQMIGYQNSRLRTFHSAKQILGVIVPSDESGQDLCIRAVGSTEPMPLREWISEFEGGVLARMTIEKVEELGEPKKPKKPRRWRGAGKTR